MAASRTLRAYCIGHVPPVFTPTLPFTMLTPRPLGVRGEIVLADQRFGLGIQGAALAEYSQLFGLQDLLEAGDLVADRLYLFQYRKFIGLREGGLPATAPWLRIAPPAQTRSLMPTEAELHAVSMPVVVGSMFALGSSVAQNYALVHVVDDLVTFAACLPAAGFEPAAVRRFASFQGLLPSPALCLVDTPLFLAHMRTLRAAWAEYTRGGADVRREGYQMRVAGYLLERLHSHLLCQGLADGTQPHVGLGHRYVVMDPAAPAVPSKAPSPATTEVLPTP
jgi:hypothetical protein